MDSAAYAYAQPGHNLIDPLDAEIDAALKSFKDDFDDRGPQIDRCQVTNDDEAGRATALAGILADIAKRTDAARVDIKAPYLRATKTIDASFTAFIDAVKLAKVGVVRKIDDYRREQERKRRAEADRLAKEAAEKEAAARKAQAEGNAAQAAKLEQASEQARVASTETLAETKQPIRSAYGQTASSRTVWKFEVTDRTQLPSSVMAHPKVREAQDVVIASLVRGGERAIPGVRIYSGTETVIRS